MQSLLTAPKLKRSQEEVPDDTTPAGDPNAYVCERCNYRCDKKSFINCICTHCQWRVLSKISTVQDLRTFSTD